MATTLETMVTIRLVGMGNVGRNPIPVQKHFVCCLQGGSVKEHLATEDKAPLQSAKSIIVAKSPSH